MKSRKIRTFIPEDTSVYANPYISFPAERNIDNTKSSFDLRYNKNYKVNSKRVFNISSEYRDIDRAIKPDLLHPSTLDRILTMENQDGTTACVDLLNQTDKKYQHKKSKPKKHYYAVTKTATIAADIGIPTSEEAKVTKVLATSPMQLEKMLFKDYYGTRVGRKNSPKELHMIYNFDNWLQTRVVSEDDQSVVGRTIYYYNPSEMRPLEMNAFAKTIWTQKSVYVPVRFGTDVKPMSTSSAIVPVNDYMNQQSANFAQNVNNPPQTAQPAQQAQQYVYSDDVDDSGYTVEFPESLNVSYIPSRKGNEAGVTGGVDIKAKYVREMLKKIWHGRQQTYSTRADSFLKLCTKNNWDPEKILNNAKIKKAEKLTEDDKSVIRYLCNPYYRDNDENWWNIVKTGADIRKPEKTESVPVPNIQTNVTAQKTEQVQSTQPVVSTEVAVPPQNETVSLDQQPVQQPAEQQSVIENAMNEPVRQRIGRHSPAAQPVEQQAAQSVFNGDQKQKSGPLPKRPREELIEKLVKLINSKDAFKNALTTFAIRKYIDGADVSIIIKNIFNSEKKSPKSLFDEYIMDLYKNPAASKYEMDIADIAGLFKAIDGYDYF